MEKLTDKSIRTTLERILPGKKITNVCLIKEISVNRLATFSCNDKKYLMKILVRPPTSQNEYYRLEKEAKLMKYFKQQNKLTSILSDGYISVPVPEIIHIEKNEELLGYKFIVMEYIQGKNLGALWTSFSIKEKKSIIRQLSSIVKSIHSIKYEMFGQIEEFDLPRRFYSFESLIKANTRRFAQILGKKDILPIKLVTKAVRYVEDNLEKMTYISEPVLVHRDLNQSNFIIDVKKANNPEIIAVLDFEWSYAGNPLVDLFNIEEWLGTEQVLYKEFLRNYFQDKRDNLEEFKIERDIYLIHDLLETIAIGWVNFHPTKENIHYVEKGLKEIINE